MIDWTEGGESLAYQHCSACAQIWYFKRGFCPACGSKSPVTSISAGMGTVHARTLVHRAPSDEFRALAPYCIVLVDLDEGFRAMAHADPALMIGDRVRCTIKAIAGRLLPYVEACC